MSNDAYDATIYYHPDGTVDTTIGNPGFDTYLGGAGQDHQAWDPRYVESNDWAHFGAANWNDYKKLFEQYNPGGSWVPGEHGELRYNAAPGSMITSPPKLSGDSGGWMEKNGWMIPLALGGLAFTGAIGGGAAGAAEGALSGGLDGALADTAANYAAGMGSNNILTGAASGFGGASLPDSYWSQLADAGGTASDASPVGAGTMGTDYGVNTGGLDSVLGDSASNYTSGMGAANALTTSGGGAMDSIMQYLKSVSPNAYAQLAGSAIQGIGGLLGANAQTKAAQNANDTTWAMYNQNRADLAPWRQAGAGALGQLVNLTTPGNQFTAMQADPGYQFRLSEGQNALDNRLKAGGKFYSGTALKGGQDYAQGMASQEFGNVYNRLAGLAGTGQTATQNTAQLGATAAGQAAANENAMGAARASGYGGLAGAAVGGLNNYNQQQQFAQMMDFLYKKNGVMA